ncbi:MAG: class I SAM-dependent methyltransferase, partial [Pseudomonadota bacterium]|nr:class I SAM-dependent methyltransferase [Pseudomonadota bacterium]
MDDDKPFDRRLRRLRRDRAARNFADADYLHRLVAEELLERLSLVKRDFRDALVLGGADGSLAAGLDARGIGVTAADPGRLFAEGSAVQCDEDRLPFAGASFDLIISLGTLDSVNDLPGALILIRHGLRPDGLFLAAFA